MGLNKKLVSAFFCLSILAIVFSSATVVKAVPTPSTQTLTYEELQGTQCKLHIGVGKSIPILGSTTIDPTAPTTITNEILTRGSQPQKVIDDVIFSSPKIIHYGGTLIGVVGDITVYKMGDITKNGVRLDGGHNYYLGIWQEAVVNDQGASQQLTYTTKSVMIALTGTSWDEAHGGTGAEFGSAGHYIAWYENEQKDRCQTEATESGQGTTTTWSASNIHNIGTTHVFETTINNGVRNTVNWYYVATMRYKGGFGQAAIYRDIANHNRFLAVSTDGTVMGKYDGTKPDWKQQDSAGDGSGVFSTKIGTSDDPYQTITDPATYFTASMTIDFKPLLSATPPQVTDAEITSNRDITVEIRLDDGGSGPFTHKFFGSPQQDGVYPHGKATADFEKTGVVVSSQIVVLTEKDSATYQVDNSLLVRKIEIYAHKNIAPGGTNDAAGPYLEAFETVDLAADFRDSTDSNGALHQVLKDEKRVIPAKKVTSLKHAGSSEENSVSSDIGDAIAKADIFSQIKNAILNALKAIALMIQKAIISLALWLIGLVSDQVPI